MFDGLLDFMYHLGESRLVHVVRLDFFWVQYLSGMLHGVKNI
jgi:hypothetical protein